MANAGDGSGRLFVAEQGGTIRVLRNGTAAATPFLDISSRISCCGERGLLGLAFPPGYAAKGHFYVYYTNANFDITISRFAVTGNPDVADPASEQVLLTIPHRDAPNHNGGQLAFGKDGFLYIGTGDGGGGGDVLKNGQNPAALLAKILRIDVESGTAPYAIPPTNPFVNKPGFRPEIWAWGLRNPWRFSFDRLTGDLYIADVGQDLYEEIDYQPAADPGGENYGWSIMEGKHCYNAASCSEAGLTLPVIEYPHTNGNCAVIGGYVYRGARYPAMQGNYIHGDFCTGRIWSARGPAWQPQELLKTGWNISTFGQDEAGELYVDNRDTGDIYTLAFGAPATSAGVAAVVNAASFEPGISPGSIATLFGSKILPAGTQGATGFPLPRFLGGTSVTVNNVPAPLYAVVNANGSEQINFQVPYEAAGAPQATVAVAMYGIGTGQFTVPVLAAQPAIFTMDGTHAAAVKESGVLVVYGTGFGAVNNPPATGAAASASTTTVTPTVTVGGQSAAVLYSGLAPGFAGLYQLNVQIPAGLPAGDADLVVTFGNIASKAVRVTLP